MKESDLYAPLKCLLESQGYEVKGEIGNCDVFAVRGEEPPVIVELKLACNLDVVLQAVDRLSLTPKVYVGIPRPCQGFERRRKPMLKLLRMLGLGLLMIDPEARVGSVDVLLDPRDYRPRRSRRGRERLLGEFMNLVGDPNLGGTERRKGLMTAYRQKALAIAAVLGEGGPTKASSVARAIGEPKSREIMYRNVYGWFERVSNGVYRLSPRGEREVPAWQEATGSAPADSFVSDMRPGGAGASDAPPGSESPD